MFDALIIGGGVSGLSCALILGSAKEKVFAKDKKIGIIVHQRTSHLHDALLNNVLGIPEKTPGKSILVSGKEKLKTQYSHINQIDKEKVFKLSRIVNGFEIETNKNTYVSKIVVIAVGYLELISIEGLEKYIEPHPRAKAEKSRIWLKNNDHIIEDGLYVTGTLAGWRSQFAIKLLHKSMLIW
jgi:thioredoxin reductase